MRNPRSLPLAERLAAAPGEMGRAIASADWAATALGPMANWPATLAAVVDLMVRTPWPACIGWGPDQITLYNDAYAALLGARHPEALGRTARHVFADIWDRIGPDREAALAGRPHQVDSAPLALGGREAPETWLSFAYTPIAGEDGRPAGIYVVALDVTAKVNAERGLAIERERRRNVLEGMAEGYVLVGPDLTIVDANANAGAREPEASAPPRLVGRRLRDAVPAEVASELDRLCSDAMAESRPVSAEHRTSDPSGRTRWLDFRAYPTADGHVALFSRDVTDRREADAQLVTSEERLRLAIEHAEIGFWDVDVVNDVMIWPARVKAMFGIPADAPVSIRDFYDGLHPEDRERTARAYAAALDPERRALYDVEYRTVGRDDRIVRWIAAKGRGIFDETGRCTRVIGSAIDITERKSAEERLRALNADLERQVAERTLARGRTWQLSPDLMGVLNAEGMFELSNPAWQALLGWSEEEITATPFLDFVHPDDVGRTLKAWEDIQRGLPAIRFENRYRTKAGGWRWLSWIAVPEEDKVYGIARDISDARAQAEALAERTAERDRIWRLSTDIMLVAGLDGTIRAVNPAWTALFGWVEGDLVGRRFLDLVHPEDRDQTIEEVARLSEGITTFRFENRYRARDGSFRAISWTAVPDMGLIHAVGRDVTADRAREAELAAAQEALRQSQKMESLGQLTGGIAHDFNNLLTPILGSLDMLQRRRVGSDRERRIIDGALQAAERARTLVQRLLAFARRQPLQPAPVNVARIVTSMSDLIESTAGPKIRVVVDCASDLPPAVADPNQLEMALLNLGVNARDAMPEGGTLRIAAASETVRGTHGAGLAPGSYVRLSVSDTGIGMDEATRLRAIEPFYSKKGVGKGTGLGLSMVHGLVLQLGGGLAIESSPGAGTTVTLWLRKSVAASEAAPAEDAAEATGSGGATALLVDDEALVRLSIAVMLGELGYDVIEASSGEEALRLLGGGVTADIVITDQLMPGMTGVELAQAVRRIYPGVPILVVSGYADDDTCLLDLPRLSKPFRNDELSAILARLQPPRRSQSEEPASDPGVPQA